MPRFRSASALAAFAAVVLACPAARATYSVLLHDAVTAEFGAAAVSCVGDFDLSLVFGAVPRSPQVITGFVFFAQATYSEENRARILEWGAMGQEPQQILDTLTRPGYDPLAAERQYHFLSSAGTPLTWTGSATLPYAGARSGAVPGSAAQWSFTTAGNILSSERVLSQMVDALEQNTGPMEERLFAALRAGAENGEGDVRCGDLPGDSAFLTVLSESGASRLTLRVIDSQPEDPLSLLGAALTQAPPPPSSATLLPEESVPARSSVPSNTAGCRAAPMPRTGWHLELLYLLLLLVRRRRPNGSGGRPSLSAS